MKTGIATAIFLLSVVLTLLLFYLKFDRKGDSAEFVKKKTITIANLLAALVFIGTLTVGFNIVFLFLAFALLFCLLLINR